MRKQKPKHLKPAGIIDGYKYVLCADIEKLHGADWYKQFGKAMDVCTCPMVEAGPAVFFHDYLRYADVLDGISKDTYFD